MGDKPLAEGVERDIRSLVEMAYMRPSQLFKASNGSFEIKPIGPAYQDNSYELTKKYIEVGVPKGQWPFCKGRHEKA